MTIQLVADREYIYDLISSLGEFVQYVCVSKRHTVYTVIMRNHNVMIFVIKP